MRRFMPLLVAAALVLSTAAANADLGDQLFKLLPDDGAAYDEFGESVAISGATAIVGASHDDDNGSGSGSAHLFDTTTGQWIAMLLPDDGASGDRFGVSVAISGTTAIVGAYVADNVDNGINSGSAYLFDTITGQQLAKLLPSDGAAFDGFRNLGCSQRHHRHRRGHRGRRQRGPLRFSVPLRHDHGPATCQAPAERWRGVGPLRPLRCDQQHHCHHRVRSE